MASHEYDQDEMITGINITPMVDVILVLLVVFMITAPTLYESGIKLDLPKALTGEQIGKITLRFNLLNNNTIVLDNREVTKEEVPGLIKKALELDPLTDAVVAGDRSLSLGYVIEFVDSIKISGIPRVAMAVETLVKK